MKVLTNANMPLSHKKEKISYVIDNFKVGGAQVHLLGLIKEIRATFDIELISLGVMSKSLVSQIPPGITIKSINMTSVRNIEFWQSFFNLIAHFRKNRPEVVHTYLNTANVFGFLAAKIGGVKHLMASRRDMGHFRSKRIAFVEGILCRMFASRVLCVCKAVAKETRLREHIPARKLKVIYNGVDVDRFKPKTNYERFGTLRFAMVAAMDRPAKGHEDFIRAAGIASETMAGKFEFFLVGDGPLRKNLEGLARKLRCSTSFQFIGEIKELENILPKMDVLVVPSHTEGISNAALEAMATGLPIIATAVDGNLELVVNGKTGFLITPNDCQSLSRAMLLYGAEQHLVEFHGLEARERIKLLFNIHLMKSAYCELYNQVVHA